MKRTLAALGAVLITTSTAFAVGQTYQTAAGPAYVNGRGMTLYTLSRDPPFTSTCYRKCVEIWPPYLARGQAKAHGQWTVIQRRDGSLMWAFRGKPVYAFFKDRRPGDAKGSGVRDRWGYWTVAIAGQGGRYVTRQYRRDRDYGATFDYAPMDNGYGSGGYGGSGGGMGGGGGY